MRVYINNVKINYHEKKVYSIHVGSIPVGSIKKERPERESLRMEMQESLSSDFETQFSSDEIPDMNSSGPKAEGVKQIPIKLAQSKIEGAWGEYFEFVDHGDYFIDVPSRPGLMDKMKLSVEVKRIAEGNPNGWTPDKKIANSYIFITIKNKEGKKYLVSTLRDPQDELKDLSVGETKWYTFDLSDGEGNFMLTDEELEGLDSFIADDSDLRFYKD